MPNSLIRIATRKSPLALWQANHVRQELLHHWPKLRIELVPMKTSGDTFLKDKLLTVGGKGLFVKELEEALLEQRADLAVHSMKDVPAVLPEGLSLVAMCTRHNPLDAFISTTYKNLASLPMGANIGTSSLRRQSQLLAIRPDLAIIPLRGNIHTRLNKLDMGEFDAIILAAAGLERMKMQNRIQETLTDDLMLPACGQGALGIECRTSDEALHHLIAPLNDPITAQCVHSERHVNALLGGNCHVPIAVFCQFLSPQNLLLRAMVAKEDGSLMIHDRRHGHPDEAMLMAEQCANALLAKGAYDLLTTVSSL